MLSGEGTRSICSSGFMTNPLFTSDGKELLTWGNAKGIHHWEIATGDHRVQTTDTLDCYVAVAAFSPDQQHLVLAGATDHLMLIDVASGKKVRWSKAGLGCLYSIPEAVCEDSRHDGEDALRGVDLQMASFGLWTLSREPFNAS